MESFKQYFTEMAMKNHHTMEDDYYVLIEVLKNKQSIRIYLKEKETNKPLGILYVYSPYTKYWKNHKLPHLFQIDSNIVSKKHQHKGWGPLLYDIAMEYVYHKFHGAIISSIGVNGSSNLNSIPVWIKYATRRPDVKRIPNAGIPITDIDTQEFLETQVSPKCNHIPLEDLMEILTSAYYKKPKTLFALKQSNRLQIKYH